MNKIKKGITIGLVLVLLLSNCYPAVVNVSAGDEPVVVTETPTVETPAVETPAVETPAVETPAVETPAVETPVVETPAVETPAVETPAAETTVVETPTLSATANAKAAGAPLVKFTLLPAITGKTEYLTNESTTINLDIDMTDMTETLLNPSVTVTLPNTYLGTINASDIQSATKTVATNTPAGYTTITYTFGQLTGGTTIRIPIIVQTKLYDTPDNYILPIDATLNGADGTVLQQTEQLQLKQQVVPLAIRKIRQVNSVWYDADGTIGFGGIADSNNTNLISETGASYQVFSYDLLSQGRNTNSGAGSRRYAQQIIEDTLPAGAVFVAADNPGWTYDSGTNKVTYIYNNSSTYSATSGSVYRMTNVQLKLKFPGADTQNTFTNAMKITLIPDKEQPYEDDFASSDDITFKMNTQLPGIRFSKSANRYVIDQIDNKKQPINWSLQMSNISTDINLENIVLEDLNLDARLQYTGVRLDTNTATQYSGTVNMEAIDSAGVVTTVAVAIPVTDHTIYPVPEGTTRIRVTSTAGSYLLPNSSLQVTVITELIDPQNIHATGNTTIDNFKNGATTSGNYVGSTTTLNNSTTGIANFLKYTPAVYLTKSLSTSTALVNTVVTANIQIWSNWSTNPVLNPDTINLQKVVDLLPIGMVYVPNSATYTNNSGNIANNNLLISKEPQVVDNYKGTGQTALIWTAAKAITGNGNYLYGGISFQLKVLKETAEGANINKAYAIWDNNGSSVDPEIQKIGITSGATSDGMDLDGDGNTTEQVAAATANFTYIPPRELIASKYVKGSLDALYMLTGGKSELGETGAIQLRINNKSIVDVKNLSAIEVLPYKGDQAIVANEQGTYVARSSLFSTPLTGPVTGPAGYTIYYTNELPTGTAAAYAAGTSWTTTPTDYAAVRGIKIVMDTGTVLPVNSTIEFTVPVQIPLDQSIQSGQRAMNSFAISTNGTDYLEATASSIEAVKYAVTGITFLDQNKNGMRDMNDTELEKILPGVKVYLEDVNGTAVLDSNGTPITAVTDENGAYQMTTLHNGTYRVRFEAPEYYKITEPGADSNEQASHIVSQTTYSSKFELNANNQTSIRNGGYYLAFGDLIISKVLKDYSGLVLTEKRDFTYEIAVNNVLYNGTVMVNDVAVQVTDGHMVIQNGDSVVVKNLPIGALYQVKELNADDYDIAPEDGEISGSILETEQTIAFENTEQALGQLTIRKVLQDASGNEIAESRDFTIMVTGPSYPEGKEMTLTNGTDIVLPDLICGTYQVKELNTDGYDVTITPEVELSLANKAGTITVTNKEQALGQLTIKKVLQNYDGSNITEKQHFTVKVTGPSYPEGKEMTVTKGEDLIAS
ncbi:MAG: SdrD B-like domain-containing protein, partial [Lachnospiraceae bacterium]|nr:SdrD B-like domain-containing protein [Lachnospiraceae bacterium]